MPISIPSFHFASALQGFSLVRAVLGESSPSRPVRPPRFVRSDFLQACHIPGSFLDDLVEFESPEPTTPEGCYLLQLPNDVVISLCLHLDIFGILRLRQVNKRLYKLTHHGTVWKQLLRRSRIPLPPVPPTTRNSLEQLNGFEVERLLSRAYSVDKAWNSDNIRPYVHWQFPTYAHVLSMVVLPGGQFLVASVTDDYRHHYGVMVYTMDHRLGRCVAQARTETATKAYHLQAKYLSFKGELGIAIAYVRRDFKRASDRTRGIDISVYTDDWVDPEIPLKYECQVLHISLRALETLADPRIVPGSEEYIRHAQREGHSFKTLARIRTSSILGLPALDELFDKPYLALPKLPDRIIFQPLCGGPASILHCRNTEVYPDTQHTIMAIRPLPCQQQVLVIREIGKPREGEYVLELFNIVRNDSDVDMEYAPDAVDSRWHEHDEHGTLSNVQISDHGIGTREDRSVHGQLRGELEDPAAHPITIWAQRYERVEDTRYGMHPYAYKGIMRILLFPKRHELYLPGPRTMVTYSYSLEDVARHSALERVSTDYVPRILPGTYRSFLYMTPDDDRRDAPAIYKVARFCDPQLSARSVEEASEGEEETCALEVIFPSEIDMSSVAALAWDQSIGRLCVASSNSTTVHVLDFSHAPRQDTAGTRLPIPLEIEPDPDMLMTPLDVQTGPETDDELQKRVEAAYTVQLPWSHLTETWSRRANDVAHDGAHEAALRAPQMLV